MPHDRATPTEARLRNKVRKGTRSCWECKKRKVRCLNIENGVCSGCAARGTTCLSQDFPEEYSSSSGTQVGERLHRVERLLETIISKISAFEAAEESQKIDTPESISIDITSHSSKGAPMLSLFDNAVIGRRRDEPGISTPSAQSSGGKTPCCRLPTKIDRIRQTLVDLLPSQHDENLVSSSSSFLLLLRATPLGARFQSAIDSASISQLHPTVIAIAILTYAMCLQQLPPDFDVTQLQDINSVDAQVEKYLSTVHALVTSDDEMVSNTEGLECLTLEGVYHLNAGSPRRAWLTLRRALSMGQLIGMHRRETPPEKRALWFEIVKSERYLSLLLGLPSGSNDDGFGPEETFQNPDIDKDLLFTRRLCEISNRIIQRNQAEGSHAYATTQEIDDRLESLAKEMPHSWWEVVPPAIDQGMSSTTASLFKRTMDQIWYFQLEAFLHLPFMLRAATDLRYNYSKFNCLKASREMVYRYLSLKQTYRALFYCKIIDFGVLSATVTLILGLIEPIQGSVGHEMQEQRESDKALVQLVLSEFEELSMDGKDVISTQSVQVIRTLLAAQSNSSSPLSLTIPYFGTININRKNPAPSEANVPVLQHQHTVPGGRQMPPQTWQGSPFATESFINTPTVSFTSSQFPPVLPLSIQNWGLEEADTMFFNNLWNTDIDGNMIF